MKISTFDYGIYLIYKILCLIGIVILGYIIALEARYSISIKGVIYEVAYLPPPECSLDSIHSGSKVIFNGDKRELGSVESHIYSSLPDDLHIEIKK